MTSDWVAGIVRAGSRIQKQRVIPVFRGGKRMCSGAGARPRIDRNPIPEAVDAGLAAFVVFFEKGTGYSLQRAQSGFRYFLRCPVPLD